MSAATSPVEAAARARRQATVVAAVGAVVPTILAAQGMTYLAIDVLGFPVAAAVALAGFLELALVSSALLARAAALAGRPGGADAVAVWVVSGTSGLLAGVHELVVTTPAGSAWSVEPGSVLAAAVRVVAPLVAAWLWERVLQAARAEQAQRTLVEVRRDRRLLDVARAALLVRRLDAAGRSSSRRAARARRRLDRAHVAALRVAPPAPTLVDVLAAVGQVDHLPAATRVVPLVERAAEPQPERLAVVAAQPRASSVTAHVQGYDMPALFASDADEHQDDDEPDTLAVAVDVLRDDPAVTGARLAEVLTERGCPVSVRSGQRWRARAAAALAAEAECQPDPS